MNYSQILDEAKKLEPFLIETRRFLHRNPELSWHEFRTSTYLKSLLQNEGISITKSLAKTGFYVDLGNEDENRIAWRADMDALAIQDQKNIPYASAFDGVAHLCGHDVHSTIALGIAILYKRSQFERPVRILFQPAEEKSPSGAPVMIEEGAIEGINRILALHCDPNIKSHKLAINSGNETASYDGIFITMKTDSTAHSARPHNGKDLIWISTLLLQQWFGAAGRITDARDGSVLSFGSIHAGEAMNVIPNKLTLSGTLRSVSLENRAVLMKFFVDSAKFLAETHDVEIEVRYDKGAPPVHNDAHIVKEARSILRDHAQLTKTRSSMGAEDFAWYTQEIPALMLRMGTQKDEATSYPLHHSCFDVDESVIAPTAAKIAYLLNNLE